MKKWALRVVAPVLALGHHRGTIDCHVEGCLEELW